MILGAPIIALLMGNIFYIMRTAGSVAPKSRLSRLLTLWFDAKERELRERGVYRREGSNQLWLRVGVGQCHTYLKDSMR